MIELDKFELSGSSERSVKILLGGVRRMRDSILGEARTMFNALGYFEREWDNEINRSRVKDTAELLAIVDKLSQILDKGTAKLALLRGEKGDSEDGL